MIHKVCARCGRMAEDAARLVCNRLTEDLGGTRETYHCQGRLRPMDDAEAAAYQLGGYSAVRRMVFARIRDHLDRLERELHGEKP